MFSAISAVKTYAQAGVDIAAADRAKAEIRRLAAATFSRNVLSEIGGFGGLFRFPRGRWRDPVLVSSADGVGTKLKIAFLAGRHDTIGRDLVNHCVNDIAVCGAEPLFFLDYIATARLDPAVVTDVVAGLAAACRENACALIGGETAQMPGFYAEGEYDVAGFIVGVVERKKILDGRDVRPGDVLIGLSSTGLHTNGYSLARKILFEQADLSVDSRAPELDGAVGEVLLRVHRSYLRVLRALNAAGHLLAAAHITGGGITENLPRVLPEGTGARMKLDSWPVPPLFRYLQKLGNVSRPEMFRTFNMGIGLVLVVPPKRYKKAAALLKRLDEQHYVVGEIVRAKGRPAVEYV